MYLFLEISLYIDMLQDIRSDDRNEVECNGWMFSIRRESTSARRGSFGGKVRRYGYVYTQDFKSGT